MIKPHVRAVIAATAISHATRRSVDSVYQYGSDSGYKNISIQIAGTTVTGYDYTKSAHFTGTMPDLYHYGESCHVEFKPEGGGRYTGYVYGAGGAHFEVTVSGTSASFYDYGGSGYTEFST
jgi:hypothetical protein